MGLITPRLVKAGHPTAVISNYGHQGSVMSWNGVNIFGNSYHPYAMDIMHGHATSFGADFLVTVIDLQVMEPDKLLGTKWAAWFPVDHHNIPPVILNNAKLADYRICMSKHGRDEVLNNGADCDYIPCAVDTNIYKPLDKAACREELQLPADKFIVGMVAMNKGNPSRKAFHQNIAAFAALHKKHPDTVLYLHTADGTRVPDGELLTEFCRVLGLTIGYHMHESSDTADVIFANQYGLAVGYEPPLMAKLYNCFDVYTGVTRGEGFGIPLLEAQSCGVPVILGDWSSMSELHFSGWKVERSEAEPIFTPMMAWQYQPHAGAIAERMEAAYQMRGNKDYGKRARAGAQAYDIEKVMSAYWLPVLDKVLNTAKTTNGIQKKLDVLL